MGLQGKESSVKKILRDLCFNNGCSYAVLWRFDPRNHMLLTMEDACYGEHVGSLVESMSSQVHMLGEGKIGEAALDGTHRWISVDALDAAWDDSDFAVQFSSGIKTIVVVPLEMHGVAQFGFTKEILEKPEFLDQARRFILGQESSVEVGLAGSSSSSLNCGAVGQNDSMANVISSQNSFLGDVDVSTCWANVTENMGSSWMLDSLLLPEDGKNGDQSGDGGVIIDPKFESLVNDVVAGDMCGSRLNTALDMIEGQFNGHCSPSLFDACQIDDFPQWLADPSKLYATALESHVIDDVSRTFNVDCLSSITGGLSRSSIQNALNSCGEDKPLGTPVNSHELSVNQLGMTADCGKQEDCLKDVIHLLGDKGNPLVIDTSMSISECLSGMECSPVVAPRKGLFSELGLEHLLRDGSCTSSVAKSCVDDPWTISKKRRLECCQSSNNQTQLGCNFWNGSQIPHFGSLKECNPKSQAELCSDDSNVMDAKSCVSAVSAPTKTPEEPAKPTKKRAKAGESTRPRPKDRQMIADRIKELRDMIPNGAKLSIDALLARTVKHMLFLQSLTKHADKLKQLSKSNLTGDNMASICSGSKSSRGATWAYEVGGQNLLCPIIVEDLCHPGQMLIEMLCEEHGYFLQIADVVRGLGLTIIKGVMESRDDKIWAHYIVEGNSNVTRMEVFVSLMHLFQGSTTTTVELNRESQPTTSVRNSGSSWSNYQHHHHLVPVPLPI